jgi:hypothetical protein
MHIGPMTFVGIQQNLIQQGSQIELSYLYLSHKVYHAREKNVYIMLILCYLSLTFNRNPRFIDLC